MNDSVVRPVCSSRGLRRALSMLAFLFVVGAVSAYGQLPMLHASGTNVVNASGEVVPLRGVNLGGWFIMEKWMCPLTSDSEPDTYTVMQTLDSRFGVSEEESLINTYQQSWITTQDLDNIKALGFNVIRVPVWYGQFYYLNNVSNSGWRPDAFNELDWVVNQAAQRGIYTIIDMHGVVGGQSTSDDTGYANQNQYWGNSSDQGNTAWMWWQIANHYNGNPDVAGYDLINEPTGAPSNSAVISAYASLYNTIRGVDANHMIIMEGTWGNWNWSMLPAPSTEGWTNVMYEMHSYCWNCSASQIEQSADNDVSDFQNHASYNVPGYIGEFNDFGAGSNVWQYAANAYDNAGLSWTAWAYKATHGLVPDSWGFYDPTWWPTTPNIGSDSSATIASDWQQWTTANAFGLSSAQGITGGVNNGNVEAPYGGTAWSLPGTVQAENFDTGGDNVAYYTTDNINHGGQYRTSEGVSIETTSDTGGGYDVGWTAAGQWMNYTVNVTASGSYIFNARVADPGTGAQIYFAVDGTNVTGSMNIPDTGGWQTWTTISSNAVNLTAGQHVITLYEQTAGTAGVGNYNWFSVTAAGGSINSSAWYEVVNKTSGLCMDAAGWGTSNGTILQQWTCGSQQYNQEWQFGAAATGGYDAVYNRNAPALVWDNEGSTTAGNAVWLWTYGSGNTNQEWEPVSVGNNLWNFVNLTSGMCLDNTGSTSTGVEMTQWTCESGNTNQEFSLVQEP